MRLNGTYGTVVGGIVAGMMMVAGSAMAYQPKAEGAGKGTAAVKEALTAEERARGVAMMEKAIAYLKTKQDKATGGWNVPAKGPTFPAITGLVVNGMLLKPGASATDESVTLAHKFMLNYVKDDGGIYDKAGEQAVLPSYNTAICVSALSKFTDQKSKDAVKNGAEFLKRLQNSEGAVFDKAAMNDAGEKVGKDHPFYGGWGYGKSGRPDMSNSGFALDALHAAGVEPSDAAFQRALVFLQRVQMIEQIDGKPVNDMEYAKGSKQGGFIYSTSLSKDQKGSGETKSAMIEETLDDGTKVSRLRAYGSMTYAGFKSYLYAGLSKNDPRVTAARAWVSQNYTLKENPGVGTDGMYYYFVTFARANAAFGEVSIEVVNPETKAKETRRWAADLINRLAELQEPDGSFKSVDDRWMENDAVLITAYSLIALGEAVKQ